MPPVKTITQWTSSARAGRRLSSSSKSSSARATRLFGRRSAGSVRAGGVSKPARGNTRPIVISRNLRSNCILPDRVVTCLTNTLDMYWTVGAMTAAAGNYADIMVNSLTPWTNCTYPVTDFPAPTYAFAAVPIQGASGVQTPMGYTFYATNYTNYRVLRYTLEITATSQNTGDTFRIVAFPMGEEEIPSAAAGNVNLKVLESQPYAKAKNITSGVAPPGGPILQLKGTPYNDLGKTRDQYLGEPDTLVSGVPAAGVRDFVGVFCQQLNGANNTSVCTVQFKLMQEIMFYDAIQQFN